MRMKVVDLMDVYKSPTCCLSPLRYLDECHRCNVFITRVTGERRRARLQGDDLSVGKAVDDAINSLKCKPHIKDEIVAMLVRKEKLLAELHEINEKLDKAGKIVW